MKYQYLVISEGGNYFYKDIAELNEWLANDEVTPGDIMDDFPEDMDNGYWGSKVIILKLDEIVEPSVKLSV
jgi:hypothetical protein